VIFISDISTHLNGLVEFKFFGFQFYELVFKVYGLRVYGLSFKVYITTWTIWEGLWDMCRGLYI